MPGSEGEQRCCGHCGRGDDPKAGSADFYTWWLLCSTVLSFIVSEGLFLMSYLLRILELFTDVHFRELCEQSFLAVCLNRPSIQVERERMA